MRVAPRRNECVRLFVVPRPTAHRTSSSPLLLERESRKGWWGGGGRNEVLRASIGCPTQTSHVAAPMLCFAMVKAVSGEYSRQKARQAKAKAWGGRRRVGLACHGLRRNAGSRIEVGVVEGGGRPACRSMHRWGWGKPSNPSARKHQPPVRRANHVHVVQTRTARGIRNTAVGKGG